MPDPTRAQLIAALKRADAAGDVPAARAIARRIQNLSQAQTRVERRAQGQPRSTMTKITAGLRSIARGAADTPDMLAAAGHYLNPATWLGINEAAGVEAPRALGNIAVDRAADAAGAGRAEEGSGREQLINAGIRGAAGALVPIGGPLTRGARAVEAVSGALGGAASEGARQLGYGPTVQTIAGLGTGVAVPTAISGASQGLRAGAEFVGERGAARRTARTLQRRANDGGSAAEAAREIREAAAPSPGVVPTMAEQARNRGLAALQREANNNEIEAQVAANARQRVANVRDTGGSGSPDDLQNLAVRTGQANEAELARRTTAGRAEREALKTQGDEALRARMEANEAERLRIATQNEADLAGIQEQGQLDVEGAIERVGPYVDREADAGTLRSDFTGGLESIGDRRRAAYNARPLVVPSRVRLPRAEQAGLYSGLAARVHQFYGNLAGKPPKEASEAILDVLSEIEGKTLNTSMLANIDDRLADLAGTRRVSGAGRDALFIEKLRRELSAATDPYVSARFKKAMAKAKGLRREEAELYEQELGAPFARDRYNFDTTKDPQLVRRVIVPGDAGATMGQQLINAIGKDKATQFVRQEMRRLAEDGLLDTRANYRKYAPLLGKFEDVAADVARIRATREATGAAAAARKAAGDKAVAGQRVEARLSEGRQKLSNREALAEQGERSAAYIKEAEALNRDFAASPLGRVADTRAGPHARVAEILNSADDTAINDLYEAVRGDEAAMAGVRRAFADNMADAGPAKKVYGPDNLPIPNTADTLVEIDRVLTSRAAQFLTEEQTEALTLLKREMESAEFAKTGGVRKPEEDISHGALPTKSAWAARTIRFILQHATNQNAVDRLIAQAIREPKFAEQMLMRATTDRKQMLKRTLGRSIRGATVGTLTGETEPVPQEY